MRVFLTTAILAAPLLLAGCGGGGSSGVTPGSGTSGSGNGGSTPQSEAAISAVNDFGSHLASYALLNDATTAPTVTASTVRSTASVSGVCQNGYELLIPDSNNDANSSESRLFFDSACTQLARDAVRIYTTLGANSERVAVTTHLYAINNTTPIATTTATRTFTNATFVNYAADSTDGFNLTSSDTLSLASARTISSDVEVIVNPAQNSVSSYCMDSAGFNATGIARLNETFGWQGGVLAGGTRTYNTDGSITYVATHAGMAQKGTIGGLAVRAGVQNTTCPITQPMFTLTGGTSTGSYSIPVNVTYLHGMVTSLTVTNAALANGNTLNITTSPNGVPSASNFITAIITNGATQIATAAVNAYGDGTLTVTATGASYVIVDWRLVR